LLEAEIFLYSFTQLFFQLNFLIRKQAVHTDESRLINEKETTMCQFHVKYLYCAGVSLLINIKCSEVLVLKHLQRTALYLFNVTQLQFVFCIHLHQKPLNCPLRNVILRNYNTKMVSLIIILIFNFGSKVITNVPNFPNSVLHYQRHIR